MTKIMKGIIEHVKTKPLSTLYMVLFVITGYAYIFHCSLYMGIYTPLDDIMPLLMISILVWISQISEEK